MHHLLNTDDGIDGAGARAKIAPDALRLLDDSHVVETCHNRTDARNGRWRCQAVRFAAQKPGQPPDGFLAPRWTQVQRRRIGDNRLRVGPAAGVAALRTLDSGQDALDLVDNGIFRGRKVAAAQDQPHGQCNHDTRQDNGTCNHQNRVNPVNPKKASDMIPAVTRVIAEPRNGAGTSSPSRRSRRLLNRTRTMPNPSAAPAP